MECVKILLDAEANFDRVFGEYKEITEVNLS